jgi:alpha,alpha-trehalase
VECVEALASGGEYDVQDGFGWTNGVLLKLMNELGVNPCVNP